MNVPTRIKSKISLLFISLVGLAIACDTLEPDTIGIETEIEISEEPIFINPQTSGIIDLKSLIKSSGKYRLSTSQPRLGTLESMGNDILKYTAFTGVTSGRDGFKLSVFDKNNVVLDEDSVIIIISPDSTSIPCGIWALTDYVNHVDSVVIIDVLANDHACDVDKSLLQVSIADELEIAGTPVPPSYFGTLEVLSDGKIRYTAGPSYPGEDKFVYKVTKPADVPNVGDDEVTAFGFVYLQSSRDSIPGDTTATCQGFAAVDDLYEFSLDSIHTSDTLYLGVSGNDTLCSEAIVDIWIDEYPQGSISSAPAYGYYYVFPASASSGFTDSFKYTICISGMCDQATVTINGR